MIRKGSFKWKAPPAPGWMWTRPPRADGSKVLRCLPAPRSACWDPGGEQYHSHRITAGVFQAIENVEVLARAGTGKRKIRRAIDDRQMTT